MLMKVVTSNESNSVESLCENALQLLAAGSPAEAAHAFRAAIAADPLHVEAHHGLVRALRDAGQLNQSVAAAMELTLLTPEDPLAHTALSISLQAVGHVPQAEAAAARARILEWKSQLNSPSDGASLA
jgi:Flp pilus assembly protein TadD